MPIPHARKIEKLSISKIIEETPCYFLERVEEKIAKTGEDRWFVIRSMLDEMFREVYDNWWTAMWPNIQNFQEFKRQFKSKYWSDATQHMIRSDIGLGRYDLHGKQTPTAYFLGKINIARHLELSLIHI